MSDIHLLQLQPRRQADGETDKGNEVLEAAVEVDEVPSRVNVYVPLLPGSLSTPLIPRSLSLPESPSPRSISPYSRGCARRTRFTDSNASQLSYHCHAIILAM
jgi:hypothetical protein